MRMMRAMPMSVFRDKDNLFCQNDTVIPPFFLLREVPEGVICAQIEEAKAQIAIVGNLFFRIFVYPKPEPEQP